MSIKKWQPLTSSLDLSLSASLCSSTQELRALLTGSKEVAGLLKVFSVRFIIRARVLANYFISKIGSGDIAVREALSQWKAWTFEDAMKLKTWDETNLYLLIQRDIEGVLLYE